MEDNVRAKPYTVRQIVSIPLNIYDGFEDEADIYPVRITDIGYFHRATKHYRERDGSLSQHILIHCTEGAGWYKIANRSYKVRAHQVFVVPARVAHGYGAESKNPWSIYWVHFTGKRSISIAERLAAKKILTISKNQEDVYRERLFSSMFGALELGYSKANIEYVNICLWYYLVSFLYPDLFQVNSPVLDKDMVRDTVFFMKDNIGKSLSLKEMADNSGYSVSRFSFLFKENTGHAPGIYFLQLKMQQACNMLKGKNTRIKEIADQLGYNDPYYFSRLFKQIVGVSPRNYKRVQKG